MLRRSLLAGTVAALLALPAASQAFTIDFETDDGGNTLTNGQAICTGPGGCVVGGDTVFEFGNTVDVSTTAIGPGSHVGAATFDSTPGVNALDPDLWVDLGNILILQNDSHPNTTLDLTFGQVFDTPNDEKDPEDAGSLVFDFHSSVLLNSITLVDINGGVNVDVILTDGGGDTRTYAVPQMWTQDVEACGGLNPPACIGYHDLDLTTLLPQSGEPNATGGDAIASEVGAFDPNDVVQLEVAFKSATGSSPISGGIDNIVGVPEPGTVALLALGLLGLADRARRA